MASSTVSVPGNSQSQVCSRWEGGSAYWHLNDEGCTAGEGSGYGPSPHDPLAKRRHSVVPGGLRAHIRETVSPPPGGGGGQPNRKWSQSPASPPLPDSWLGDSWVVPAVRGRVTCVQRGPGDHEEETKRRTAAMMLRRTGPAVRVPTTESAAQIAGGRQAPWGWSAGAPYRGTASPPPPPSSSLSLGVCVCVCPRTRAHACSVLSTCPFLQDGQQYIKFRTHYEVWCDKRLRIRSSVTVSPSMQSVVPRLGLEFAVCALFHKGRAPRLLSGADPHKEQGQGGRRDGAAHRIGGARQCAPKGTGTKNGGHAPPPNCPGPTGAYCRAMLAFGGKWRSGSTSACCSGRDFVGVTSTAPPPPQTSAPTVQCFCSTGPLFSVHAQYKGMRPSEGLKGPQKQCSIFLCCQSA